MKYIVTLNGKQYEVEVDKGQATAVQLGDAPAVQASAPAAPAAPAPAAPAPSPVAAPAAAPAAGGEPIASPMPGTILSVKCAAGQAVNKGDVLFILEAMKMENEIFAPHDGVVSAVCVSQGAAVDTGTVLCTL